MHYSDHPPAAQDRILACIEHAAIATRAVPGAQAIGLPRLFGPAWEVWESDTPVTRGEIGGFRFAHNDDVMIGFLQVPEPELGQAEDASYRAYARLNEVLRAQGFPHWLRVWNYMGQIHRGEGDAERYRQFVAGRYRALATEPGFEQTLPAATAIGHQAEGLLIYLLASRQAGHQIENPRQLSAFRYPRQYGPRSPSFSRAMLANWSDQHELMVSGTASVVGHETRHAGQPLAQLRESMHNVEALVREASTMTGGQRDWVAQAIKLYVRDPADAGPAADLLQAQFPDCVRVVLQGDICREDLALEFEASYLAPV